MNFESSQLLVRNACHGKVDIRHDPTQADHGSFSAQGLEVGPDKAVSDFRQMVHVNVLGKRHPTTVDLQYLKTAVSVRDRNGYFPVKTSGSPEGWIKSIGYVRGGYHY